MSQKRKKPRKQSAATKSNTRHEVPEGSQPIVKWLASGVVFFVATLLIWSAVLPVDSVSVFTGDAQTQNLVWLICSVCCAMLVGLKGGQLQIRSYEWVIVVVLLLWLVFASWQAGASNNARIAWHGFWQVVSLAACYWCVASLAAVGNKTRTGLVLLCLMMGIATSVHGLHQLAIGFPRERAEYEKNPQAVLQSLGIDATEGSPSRLRFESRLQSPEPFATFALANSLATLLTAAIVLLLGLATALAPESKDQSAVGEQPIRGPTIVQTLFLFGILALVALCWFLTRSRTAYFAIVFAVVFGALSLWQRGAMPSLSRKAWSVVGFTTALLVVAASVWLVINDELVISQAKLSLGYRLEYWQASLAMLSDHWLTGVGLGNFQAYYPQYKLEVASEEVADPHNWILDIAATLSLPVAVAFIYWVTRKLGRLLVSQRHAVEKSGDAADVVTRNWLLLSAVLGGLSVVVLCFLLVGIDFEAVLIGWVCAGIAGWQLWPLMESTLRRWPQLPLLAAASMLVCLLSSGSWQSSGLGIPFLVLIAAGSGKPITDSSKSWVPAIVAVSGLLIFVFQSWQPVTTAWTMHQQALSERGTRQISLLEEAAKADEMDSSLYGDFAKAELVGLTTLGPTLRQADVEPALALVDAWLSKDQQRFTNWSQAGNMVLDVLGSTGSRVLTSDLPTQLETYLLSKAVHYYEQAVECYPSSVAMRAQLATAYFLAGNDAQFAEEVQEAARLSEQTPHLDKKLGQQQVFLPLSGLPPTLQKASQKVVPAEPLLQWLRSKKAEE